MTKKDMYNSSGCLDMTAFLALRNIERDELYKKRAAQRQLKLGATNNEHKGDKRHDKKILDLR